MGDIIQVDLKVLVADAIARQMLHLGTSGEQAESAMSGDERRFLRELRSNLLLGGLGEFVLSVGETNRLTRDEVQLQLVTETVGAGANRERKVVSRDDVLRAVDFKQSGRLYLEPNLTPENMNTLRGGGRLQDKEVDVWFHFQVKSTAGVMEWRDGVVTVTAEDFAEAQGRVFFGDRPLDNPGYSAMHLAGEVSDQRQRAGTIDRLDVFKVEQRLKYLGFPGVGSAGDNSPKELLVEGVFGDREQRALKLFEKVIRFRHLGQAGYGVVGDSSFGTNTNFADGVVLPPSGGAGDPADPYVIPGNPSSGITLDWLNAFNAPHWMQIGGQMQYQSYTQQPNFSVHGWNNTQNGVGAAVENYGVSWMRDLMVAQRYASGAFTSAITSTGSLFRGATDGNFGVTPGAHASHTLGMNFDMSIKDYLSGVFFTTGAVASSALNMAGLPDPVSTARNGWAWSSANAANLVAQLPNATNSNRERNYQASAMSNFLALYSVTREDGISGNNTWDDLPVVAATSDAGQRTIKSALFGDGTRDGSLLARAIIGGNSARGQNEHIRMRELLGALGIPATKYQGHQDHFHVDLKAPALVRIAVSRQNLLAASDKATSNPTQVGSGSRTAESTPKLFDASFAVCKFVTPNAPIDSAINAVGPLAGIEAYLAARGEKLSEGGFKVSVLSAPSHGELLATPREPSWGGDSFGHYRPKAGYLGQDSFAFDVQVGKRYFRVNWSVTVVSNAEEPYLTSAERRLCPEPYTVRRVGDSSEPSSLALGGWASSLLDQLNRGDGHLSLHAYVAMASGVTLFFEELPGIAVGETVGRSIALSVDAAGHGWFIDATPLDNSEYLPTADPNLWKARAGSAADGKMDMLSVLLHEYGHVLGLEHSANAHDTMAASLAPGVRRLPTADEMALMSRLVAELREREDSAAAGDIGDLGSGTPGQPLRPRQPEPLFPTGNRTAGNQRAARRPAAAGNDATPNPQFEGAVNSTLSNGDFGADTTAGWVAQGAVTTTAADSSATLAESTAGHTHLAQGFVVNPGDRMLSFTLDAQGLAANAAGPGDAFEAALLNANTGLPVLDAAGTVALSRSDALLNIQADGRERLASGVRKLTHADGSATYYIDLPAALGAHSTGTPVMLSFDLLGFGAGASRVTLRDVRLHGEPVANADAASSDEDTAASGKLLLNDVTVGSAVAQVQLVAGPAHGALTLANDGSFSYQPDTLGIQRSVQTLQGASYTLNFDPAGRLGYSSAHTPQGASTGGPAEPDPRWPLEGAGQSATHGLPGMRLACLSFPGFRSPKERS